MIEASNTYAPLPAGDLRDKSIAIYNALMLILSHEEDPRTSIEVLMHTLCVLIVSGMPKDCNSAEITAKFVEAFISKMHEVICARFGDAKVEADSMYILLEH